MSRELPQGFVLSHFATYSMETSSSLSNKHKVFKHGNFVVHLSCLSWGRRAVTPVRSECFGIRATHSYHILLAGRKWRHKNVLEVHQSPEMVSSWTTAASMLLLRTSKKEPKHPWQNADRLTPAMTIFNPGATESYFFLLNFCLVQGKQARRGTDKNVETIWENH